MKKFCSLALALLMVFALSVNAFADTQVYSGGGKITVNPGEEKIIQFTGNFSGPFYIAFSDQGQVMWRGLETGKKDFSFNLNPIDWIIKKHPDVQFINFPNRPEFIETATVQLAIPVNDAVTPSLYMVDDDDTIVAVPDVKIVGTSNKKFEFKTDKLAKTYIISSVDLSYAEPDEQDTTTPPAGDTTPVDNPPVLDPPDTKAPQTGIEDMPYMMMVGIGVLGLAVIFFKKKLI